MAEQVLGPMAGIIIFAVSAALILVFVLGSLSGFQGSFESTICKFNAWMRAATVGNPLFQSLLGGGQFLTGGFGGLAVSSITIPLVCSAAPELPERGDPFTIGEVIFKIAEESVNCWDQFGLGKWDPLVMSAQGQSFTCFQQILTINCDQNSMLDAWGESPTSDVVTAVNEACADGCKFNQGLLDKYLADKAYSYTGYEKTYADILPKGAPAIGLSPGVFPECDGVDHTYYTALYFVDSFAVMSGVVSVPLICINLGPDDLTHDSLYLCFIKYGGN